MDALLNATPPDALHPPPYRSVVDRLLDPHYRRFVRCAGGDEGPDLGPAIAEVSGELAEARRTLPRAVWREFCDVGCVGHPLHALLHEDPMSRAAWASRSRAGAEASFEDYLFGGFRPARRVAAAGPTGRAIHQAVSHLPLSAALRGRAARMAGAIDAAAESIDRPRVLAVTGGGLAEARLSAAVAEGALGEIVWFDPAAAAAGPPPLASDFADDFPAVPVRPEFGDWADLADADSPLRRRLGTFDLAYAPSLLDGLARPDAERVVAGLFDLIRPGGGLLLGNFRPSHADAGYMEAVLGWHPIRRSDGELENLAADLPRHRVCGGPHVKPVPHRAISVLEVHRC